jgi:hypothetical protein
MAISKLEELFHKGRDFMNQATDYYACW